MKTPTAEQDQQLLETPSTSFRPQIGQTSQCAWLTFNVNLMHIYIWEHFDYLFNPGLFNLIVP